MNVLEELRKIEDLPTIPTALARILRVAQNPDSDFSELVGAVETDQSLAAKVLQVANSPFYGCRREIKELDQAVMMIGFNQVRTIAIGLTAFQTLHRRSGVVRFDRELFWAHSYFCGFVCRFIAKPLGFAQADMAFVAGLLHDIGKVILDSYFPTHFAQVIGALEKHPTSFVTAEHEIIGSGHDTVGGFLLEQWQLPDELVMAVTEHHDPEFADSPLADLIYLADLIVHQAGIHSSSIEVAPDLDEVFETKAFLAVQERRDVSKEDFRSTLEGILENVDSFKEQVQGMM
jgi:putative nucleotidyltransferase with HDIG domain